MCAAALAPGGLSPCPRAKVTQSETPADFFLSHLPFVGIEIYKGPLMRLVQVGWA